MWNFILDGTRWRCVLAHCRKEMGARAVLPCSPQDAHVALGLEETQKCPPHPSAPLSWGGAIKRNKHWIVCLWDHLCPLRLSCYMDPHKDLRVW